MPHGATGPAITDFTTLPSDGPASDSAVGYQIGGTDGEGQSFTDALLLVGSGSAGTERSFGGTHDTDGIFAWARADGDGALSRLTLAEASCLADETRDLYRAPEALIIVAFTIAPPAVEILEVDGEIADSRLLAPATTQVTYQGQDVTFTQDGDYVVFDSLPGEGGGSAVETGADDDSGCGCAVPGGRHSRAPLLALFSLLLATTRRTRAPVQCAER